MIELMFYHDTEIVLVRVRDKHVTFATSTFGGYETDISGLRLDYTGVCREFPELETDKDWKLKAILKFKDKISKMKSEDEIAEYVVKDLSQHGYIPKFKQKQGFRREPI